MLFRFDRNRRLIKCQPPPPHLCCPAAQVHLTGIKLLSSLVIDMFDAVRFTFPFSLPLHHSSLERAKNRVGGGGDFVLLPEECMELLIPFMFVLS